MIEPVGVRNLTPRRWHWAHAVRRWLVSAAAMVATMAGAVSTAVGQPSGGDGPAPPSTAAEAAAVANEVSFLRDLAPVLVGHCAGCHGARRQSAGLALDRFAGLTAGGNSGSLWEAGQADESLLVQKLRGTAPDGERMPRGKPPLPDETIEKFARWINAGARFDGDNPQAGLAGLIRAWRGANLDLAELGRQRADAARRRWRLANPDRAAEEFSGDGLLVLGSAPAEALAELAKSGTAAWQELPPALRGDVPGPVKGTVVVFAFPRRFDYAEFCRMAEEREPDDGASGHWHYDGLEAYLAAVLEPGSSDPARWAELWAGLAVASWGENPDWFAAGAAQWARGRAEPRSPAAREAEKLAAQVVATQPQPGEIFTAPLTTAERRAVSGAFVGWLAKDNRRFSRLTGQLREGEAFAPALAEVYGGELNFLLEKWAGQLLRGRR